MKSAVAGVIPENQISASVQAWAKAWASKDIAGYLATYAADFETPDGLTRTAWEAQRIERIERAKNPGKFADREKIEAAVLRLIS